MSIRALVALAGTLTLSGCLGGYTPDDSPDMTPLGTDGGTMGVDVIADFNMNVAPILVGADGKSGACGACHAIAAGAGPAFLLPKPDLYTTVTSYPSLIGKSPETSRLYAKGVHEGPALTSDQASVISGWIIEYNAFKPAVMDGGAVKPSIAPFTPSTTATNTIDLSVLDPLLVGQNISFTAKVLGSSIELSNIKINTAPMNGVHIVHPLWVTWDQSFNATPDPVDSFSNLDQTVYGMTSAPMGPGTLILPGWSATSKLSVVFVQIEPKMGGADGGTVGGACKSLQTFVSQVKPLLQANCTACHVGANPTAGLSFDFGANSDATVCMNALTEINTTTPTSSLLLQRPNPAVNDSHPRKIANYAPYQAAVTNWINLEK